MVSKGYMEQSQAYHMMKWIMNYGLKNQYCVSIVMVTVRFDINFYPGPSENLV